MKKGEPSKYILMNYKSDTTELDSISAFDLDKLEEALKRRIDYRIPRSKDEDE